MCKVTSRPIRIIYDSSTIIVIYDNKKRSAMCIMSTCGNYYLYFDYVLFLILNLLTKLAFRCMI